MNKQEIFEHVSMRIEHWCRELNLPVPVFRHALPTDPCDVTDVDHIRLNIDAYDGDDYEWYAAHVFGHYICDLHCYGEPEMADAVADAIAWMFVK